MRSKSIWLSVLSASLILAIILTNKISDIEVVPCFPYQITENDPNQYCYLCSSKYFDHTEAGQQRMDKMGILFVNSGQVLPIRTDPEKGYGVMESISSEMNGSSASVFRSGGEAQIRFAIGGNHEPEDDRLKLLYCQNCQEKFRLEGGDLDVVLFSYLDYSLCSLEQNASFQFYESNITIKKFNQSVEITVTNWN